MSATTGEESNDRSFKTGIRPNFQLHWLQVRPGKMNSPSEPVVEIWTSHDAEGRRGLLGFDTLTPDQAREYARRLLLAADVAEGKQ